MKNKIYFLLVLIISMVIDIKSVGAAEELTCIYEGTWAVSELMLSQNFEGEIKMYIMQSGDWVYFWQKGMKFETDKYNSESKILTGCPNYYSELSFESKNLFHDENKGGWYNNYKLKDSKIGESSDDIAMQSFNHASFYLEEINSTEWIGKCLYAFSENSKLELYFNDDKYVVANYMASNTTARFSLKTLKQVINDARSCPPYLYVYSTVINNQMVSSRIDDLYLFSSERGGLEGVIAGSKFIKLDIPLLEGKVNMEFEEPVPPTPIVDCKGLFGEELVEQINKIMNIIKIVIPILLIAFGIIDFTKAIFAGSEENMKKTQKTFFNRIIAAVLVFIAPIFINLILSLANQVWGYISPESCIEQSK